MRVPAEKVGVEEDSTQKRPKGGEKPGAKMVPGNSPLRLMNLLHRVLECVPEPLPAAINTARTQQSPDSQPRLSWLQHFRDFNNYTQEPCGDVRVEADSVVWAGSGVLHL